MMKFLRILSKLVAIGGVLVVGFSAFSIYQYTTPSSAELPQHIVIPRGMPVKHIIAELENADLLPPFYHIALPLWLSGDYVGAKAGEYAFTEPLSPKEMFMKLREGKSVRHHITIPEGWEVWQVRNALMADARLTGALPDTIPEGSILPETYEFLRGDTRADVLAQMQAAMQETLAELWAARSPGLPIRTPQEALILASIVERETGHASERARVAAVFVNRLRAHMRLQSDPTAMYGVEQQDGPQNRAPRATDIDRDTPWNTYTRDGLPPTPIANPGRAAIEATLHPLNTDEYYFVASGEGGHRFARTLREHNRNVAEYRRIRRQQKRQSR
jgi:UPF0755 protein